MIHKTASCCKKCHIQLLKSSFRSAVFKFSFAPFEGTQILRKKKLKGIYLQLPGSVPDSSFSVWRQQADAPATGQKDTVKVVKGLLVNSCVLMGLKGSFLLITAFSGRGSRAKTSLKAVPESSSQQLVFKTMGTLVLSSLARTALCMSFNGHSPPSDWCQALEKHETLWACIQWPHTVVPPLLKNMLQKPRSGLSLPNSY